MNPSALTEARCGCVELIQELVPRQQGRPALHQVHVGVLQLGAYHGEVDGGASGLRREVRRETPAGQARVGEQQPGESDAVCHTLCDPNEFSAPLACEFVGEPGRTANTLDNNRLAKTRHQHIATYTMHLMCTND